MTAAASPLISTQQESPGAQAQTPCATVLAASGIAAVTMAVFLPTLDNGFLQLGFDDAIIVDTPELHRFSSDHLWRLATEFNHAHYVPVTLLSLALDHALWGLEPRGYHLTNVVLHALAAVLAFLFVLGILPRREAAVAALVFALHPLQVEAVSLAIQRKTILSGALFFLTLVLYQRWRRSGRRGLYLAAVVVFALAALAKPTVASLPLVLCLYEYVFVSRRIRLLEKAPFLAIGAGVSVAAIAAHAAVGANHGPHGGSLLVHVLMMSRAGAESIGSLLLPLNLSPVYYYPKDMGYAPLNFLALAGGLLAVGLVVTRWRQYPWLFFTAGWIVLVLLPQSNLMPLAQLRADRFLYLAVAGIGVAFAVAVRRLEAVCSARGALAARLSAALVLALLPFLSYRSLPVWRSDVTAWSRVVERHPWSVTAHTMLGRAYLSVGDVAGAERVLLESTRVNPSVAEPYVYLARLYLDHGARDHAARALHRLAEIAPGHPQLAELNRFR